jgi:hypothetical protein
LVNEPPIVTEAEVGVVKVKVGAASLITVVVYVFVVVPS